jgi:hypothetical protein
MDCEQLRSPTLATTVCFLDNDFVGLISAPVSVPSDARAAAAFTSIVAACGGTREMMQESACYALASQHLPAFAEHVGEVGGDVTAAALLSKAALRTVAWEFPAKCKPELHVRACVGSEAGPAFRPAFNGELKSAGDGRAIEQAVQYVAMDMTRVFFPARAYGTMPGARHFFARPPLGFALVAFPHVGYFIALEWVGKLLVSPVSAPFFLGSDAHAAAAAALPDARYAPPEAVDEALEWVTPAESAARERVAWSIKDGVFRKLVRGNYPRSGEGFAAMYRAYERLSSVLGHAPRELRLPPSARLLFGANEVLVEMPAVAGREARDAEVTEAGPVLDGVAAAVAWLARERVVYVDLRGPNVLLDADGAPWLVDFDDCLVTDAPVGSLAEFKATLAAAPAAAAPVTFAARFAAGLLPAVEHALARAFADSSGIEVSDVPDCRPQLYGGDSSE